MGAADLFFPVVEPSENGPREVGAFAKMFVEGKDLMVWLEKMKPTKILSYERSNEKVDSTNLATKWLQNH